jgi:hypothetical protein
MANIRTLGILLDTLQGGDESVLATRPAAPVARAAPTARVARDSAQSELPVTPLANRSVSPDARAGPMPAARADAEATRRSGTSGVDEPQPVIRGLYSQSPSASLELSATAQWLQRSLLSVPGQKAAGSIRASAPLVTGAPSDAPALATALRDSIVQSGLFYESHLADWAVQRYPETELRREPQAEWSGAATTPGEAPASRDPADGGPLPTRSGEALDRGQVNVELLRAQLQALESRQFAWHGELWPGQTAWMTIAEDGTSAGNAAALPWRTHLTLTLPALGTVDVDLRMDGGTLQLALAVAAPHSVELLDEQRADLISGLEAHGHAVTAVGIRQS